LDRSDPRHPLHKKYLDDYFLHQIPDLETDHSLGLSITSIEEDMDPMHFGSGGSKPISMVNNPHRDTGLRPRDSLTGSVYAGGNSVSMSRTPYLGGSWVRDNILPTSFTQQHQSPSAHSSSYQPKFEATVLSNFLCCGKEIKNLHDLLQHHESVHANQPVSNPSQLSGFQPSNARGRPSGLGQDQFAGQNNHLSANNGMYHFSAVQQQQQRSVGQVSRDQRHLAMTANMDEMEPVGDMEMDEAVGHLELDDGLLAQKRRPVFSQQQNRTMMQTNAPSGLSQALRPSQSHAAGAQTFGMQQQHDPSVTSVNTSTLAAQHHQQQLDQAFMQDHTMGHNGAGAFGAMDLSPGYGGLPNFNNLGFAAAAAMNSNNTNNNSDYCINDPAKALYSPGNPHPPGNIHLFGDTPAGRNLQHQLLQNMNLSIQGLQAHPQRPLLEQIGTMVLRGGEDDKPHKCPVVGCDKAYKNSNGLKYHKAHGHLNQQLHDNGDGTFSIINPETSTPYPGTEGMEKEKPFYCDMCNKRYKNPNGLKYHRLHSDCNPQQKLQKLQELQAAGVPGALSLFPDGLVDGMSSALNAGLPMGMPNGMGNGMDGGLSGGISNGLLAPMSDQMVDMDLSDFIDGC
jgi:transcription factor SFP1